MSFIASPVTTAKQFNLPQHGRQIVSYLLVPKSDDPKSGFLQDAVALGVGVNLLVVNRTVNLDNQRGRMAVEIDDETVDHLLTPKMESGETVGAQVCPENPFRRRHRPAELLGTGELFGCDGLADDDVGDGRGVGRNPSPGPSPKRGGEYALLPLPA